MVDLPDSLIIIFYTARSINNEATRLIRRSRQPLCDVHRCLAVERRIDTVVGEGRTQCDLPACVALRRSECCPVTSKHGCRRKNTLKVGGIGSNRGALISTEEKELVLLYGSTQSSAELVPLQRARL